MNDSNSSVAPLPFRQPRPRLPNNRDQAVKCIASLQQCLTRKPEMQQQYVAFMGKNIGEQPCWGTTISEGRGRMLVSVNIWCVSPTKTTPNQSGVWLKCPTLRHFSQRCGPHGSRPEQLTSWSLDTVWQGKDFYLGWYTANVSLFPGARKPQELLEILLVQRQWCDEKNHRLPNEGACFRQQPLPCCGHLWAQKSCQKGCMRTWKWHFGECHFYVDDRLCSISNQLLCRTQSRLAESHLQLHKFPSNSQVILRAVPPEDCAAAINSIDLRSYANSMQAGATVGDLKWHLYLLRVGWHQTLYSL